MCIGIVTLVVLILTFVISIIYLGKVNSINMAICCLSLYYSTTNFFQYTTLNFGQTYLTKFQLNENWDLYFFNYQIELIGMQILPCIFLLILVFILPQINQMQEGLGLTGQSAILIKDFSQKLKLRVNQVSENYFALLKPENPETVQPTTQL